MAVGQPLIKTLLWLQSYKRIRTKTLRSS